MSTFDEKAAEWDTPERMERARGLADAVREHVKLQPSMRGIDIGAGTGLLGLELLTELGSVVLADPSEGMIEVAEQKIAANGIADATALVYDMPGDAPPGAPFDIAVSMLVLHHVEDTKAVLRSVYMMLAPGGQMALMDLDAEDGSFHDSDAEGIHHHGFDRGKVEAMATTAGFLGVETRLVYEIERDGRAYPLFLLTGQRPATTHP
jgi:2-polyprenyl-3-methyl-5-hydroxy-6-metoxy-1,4-benzoquinol methylase